MVAKQLIVLFSIVALTFAAPVDQEDQKEVVPQAVPISTDDRKAPPGIEQLLIHPHIPLPPLPKPQGEEKDPQPTPNADVMEQVYPHIPLPEDQEGPQPPQGGEKDDLKTDASYWGWGYYRPYYRSYYGGYRWRYPYYYGGWGGHYW